MGQYWGPRFSPGQSPPLTTSSRPRADLTSRLGKRGMLPCMGSSFSVRVYLGFTRVKLAPAISVVPVMEEPVRTSGTTVAGPTTSVCAMAPWPLPGLMEPYWLGVTSRTFSVVAAGPEHT